MVKDSLLDGLSEAEQEALVELARKRVDSRISRRDTLSAAGILGAGALFGGGATTALTGRAAADASTSDGDGDIGTPGSRIDVFAEGLDAEIAVFKGQPWYDVTAYGADPSDSSADDTSAIQSAADAADSNGILYFPAASTAAEGYVISDTITFNGFLTIRGGAVPAKGWPANPGGTLIDATGVAASKPVFQCTSGDTVHVENLAIDGNTTSGSGDIFDFQNLDNVTLQNVSVDGSPRHIVYPQDVENLRIVSCFLQGSNYNGDVVHNVVSAGTRGAAFLKCVDSTFTAGDRSMLFDATGHSSDKGYLQAIDCDFLTSGQESIKVVEQGDVMLIGCDVENGGQNTATGIARFEAVKTLKISSTRMSGTAGVNQDTCIIDGCRNVSVDPSCTFNQDSGTSSEAALRLSGGDRAKIYGDYTSGGGSGIIVDDSALGAAYSTNPTKHSIMPDHIEVPGYGIWLNTSNGDNNAWEPKIIDSASTNFNGQANVGANSVIDTDWVSQ